MAEYIAKGDNRFRSLIQRVNPQNTNIVTVNKIVNDCNNIIKSATDKSGMFVYINPQKKCSNKHNSGIVRLTSLKQD